MIRRRDFIALLGGAAAARPITARAQQPAVPVIGLLRSTSATGCAYIVDALRQGLKHAGFVEGQKTSPSSIAGRPIRWTSYTGTGG